MKHIDLEIGKIEALTVLNAVYGGFLKKYTDLDLELQHFYLLIRDLPRHWPKHMVSIVFDTHAESYEKCVFYVYYDDLLIRQYCPFGEESITCFFETETHDVPITISDKLKTCFGIRWPWFSAAGASLGFPSGEIVVLKGRSNAGKSQITWNLTNPIK